MYRGSSRHTWRQTYPRVSSQVYPPCLLIAQYPTADDAVTQAIPNYRRRVQTDVKTCTGDLESRQPANVPVEFRRRNLLLGRSTLD